jgi:hypothetical protein
MLMMDDAHLLSRWCSTKGFAKLHLFLRFPNQHLGRSCAGNLKLKELPNYESLQDLWECSLTKIVNLHLGVGRVEIRICLPITLYIAISHDITKYRRKSMIQVGGLPGNNATATFTSTRA